MNILSTILDRLNQRIEVGNIFDQIYGLSELVGEGNDKAWAHYIGNGQAIPVTNFDAKQGTLFWAKRGKITVNKNETLRLAGCRSIYETRFTLTAYAMVRKSHLPCDSADAQDWVASRVLRLISGTDPQFKTAIGAIAYEVVPSGYATEARYLPVNYEWAAVAIEVDVNVSTSSEDGCYDTCQTGDIPLPDFEPCEPCLTSVAVDGVTITGNGTPADPLVAIGGGGGTPLRTQDEGVDVSTNTTTLNFTGDGVTASLTSPGVVQVNVPGGGGVTAVTASAPLASSGGATPDISIQQASASVDGYLDSADFATFAGKQDALTAGTGISLASNIVTNTAPDQIVGLTAGTGISVSGTYPNFTIDNIAPSSGGTVTSVAATVPSPTNPAFSVNVPNPSTTPSVDITANGTTSQYVRGDGSLDTFPSGLPPTGTAGGDLNGTYPNPEVHKIHGIDMQSGTPSANDVWVYGGSPAKWQHQALTQTQLPQLDATKIGSGNVSNAEFEHLDGTTSPIQTQLNAKEPTITAGTTAQYWRGDKSWQTLDKSAVGLSNVDNTSDANKPISNATQTALNAKFNTPTGNTSQYVRGDGSLATFPTIPTGTVTSVGLTMPAAFSVANSPVTGAGTLAVTGAGTTAQYIRGDGTLAALPAAPTIYKSTTDGIGITGVASEQISSSQLITGGTFAAGDIIRVNWRVTKTGSLSAITVKLYVNTSNSLVGAIQVAQNLPGFTNSNSNGYERHLIIKSATNTQTISSASAFTDYITSTAFVTSNIDWSVNQYIIFACNLASATTDTVRTSFYLIEKI